MSGAGLSGSCDARRRAPDEVLRDHLLRWRNRDLEGDLQRNYDRNVLTLTRGESLLGWDGPRRLERDLAERLAQGRRRVDALRVGPIVSVVAWSICDPATRAWAEGVDSLVIRRGRIVTQTRDLA